MCREQQMGDKELEEQGEWKREHNSNKSSKLEGKEVNFQP